MITAEAKKEKLYSHVCLPSCASLLSFHLLEYVCWLLPSEAERRKGEEDKRRKEIRSAEREKKNSQDSAISSEAIFMCLSRDEEKKANSLILEPYAVNESH